MTTVLAIGELASVATDYMLAAVALVLGLRLRARAQPAPPMAAAFFFLALAASSAGTFHGLRAHLGQTGKVCLWGTTSIAMLGLSFCLLVTYGRVRTPPRWHRALTLVAALKLGAIAVLLARDPGFLWIVVDYAASMLGLSIIYAVEAASAPDALWLYAAVAISIVAAVVQRQRISPSEAFNHNDLYHVVQLLSVGCFYRAACAAPAPPLAAPPIACDPAPSDN
jgi:hypothetical protein